MAPIRTGSHPACGRVVPALLAFLPLEELLAERLLQLTAFDFIIATLHNQVRFNAALNAAGAHRAKISRSIKKF
jgi:hypothetical protein